MTTQHIPHTPLSPTPLWRRVLSLPKTVYGWLAIGLASPSLALIVFLALSEFLGWTFTWLNMDRPDANLIGGIVVLVSLMMGLLGGMVAGVALAGGHERSWLVWVALVPLLVFFSAIWLGKVVTFALAVLILVLMVAGIAFWISRVNSREAR